MERLNSEVAQLVRERDEQRGEAAALAAALEEARAALSASEQQLREVAQTGSQLPAELEGERATVAALREEVRMIRIRCQRLSCLAASHFVAVC